MRFVTLLFLASTLGFAQTWSGYLVDSKCYTADQANTNRYAGTADRDMSMTIRQCSANTKTKAFAVVLPNWDSLSLDAAGNAKAAEFLKTAGKKSPLPVTVTGKEAKNSIQVSSIAGRVGEAAADR
jgi:hypothetical protein